VGHARFAGIGVAWRVHGFTEAFFTPLPLLKGWVAREDALVCAYPEAMVSMTRAWRWTWMLAVCGGLGCGGESAPPVAPGGGGNNNGGSSSGNGSDGGSGMDAGGDPLAPVVTVVSPEGASSLDGVDPNSDEIVVDARIDVRCKAVDNPQSAAGVDPTSITVLVESLEPDPPAPAMVDADPVGDGEYLAPDVNVEAFAAGGLRITCQASDRSDTPRVGQSVVYTYVDRGPVITFGTPTDGQQFSSSDEPIVEFTVEAAPLTKDDDEAEVAGVTVSLNGHTLDESALEVDGSTYTFSIDFENKQYFPSGTLTAAIIVEATNSRTPSPALSRKTLSLGVDDLGPTVNILAPLNESIVAGQQELQVEVTDSGSGVDPTSVTVRIGSGPSISMEASGGLFIHTLQTGGYDPASEITVEVTARDLAGNVNQAEIKLFLDNVKPWISMDPPTMRVAWPSAGFTFCSPEFDPLGGVMAGFGVEPWGFPAVDDLQLVTTKQVVFRAFLYDRTNFVKGGTAAHRSLINDATVKLAIQEDPTKGLLTDSDQDGICDGFIDDPPIQVDLQPLTPTGVTLAPTWADQQFDGFDAVVETAEVAG